MDGYWTVQEANDYQPPTDLRDFLAGGKPPVYVGFGSMADKTRAMETTRMVVEAIQRAGQRGVLATGWKGLSDELDLPEEIFVMESAPHTWLFPRMAVVVHHGGAGTTAAGLQAGTPSVVIPFALDQFAWARRVWELGVGAKPIPRKELTVSRLTAGIQEALRPSVCESAKALGEKIRGERGADRAAEVILETIHRRI